MLGERKVYLIAGVSGSGKSWVCRQLTDKFNYIAHDRCWRHPFKTPEQNALDPKWEDGAESIHLEVILKTLAEGSDHRPILTECPFAERKLKEDLERHHVKVIPYFVIEHPGIVRRRYYEREGKFPQQAVLTRAQTIKERAREWKAPFGTSDEVLSMLRGLQL